MVENPDRQAVAAALDALSEALPVVRAGAAAYVGRGADDLVAAAIEDRQHAMEQLATERAKVERLARAARWVLDVTAHSPTGHASSEVWAALADAANQCPPTSDRADLEAENERLRAALDSIARRAANATLGIDTAAIRSMAREALEGPK